MDWLIACNPEGLVIDAIELTNSWPHRSMYESASFHLVIATAPDGAIRPLSNETDDEGEKIDIYVEDMGEATSRDFDTTAGVISCPRVHENATGVQWGVE